MTEHYEIFSRLDGSFELWVKLCARGRKQQKRWQSTTIFSITERIKGSLSSSWMNSQLPILLLPLWQNESLCETIGMKIWCHLYSHSHENQVIFMIFMGNVLHSLCKWKLRRWNSKSAYALFCFIRMLFFRPRLNILIFLSILGWKHSCIILKL